MSTKYISWEEHQKLHPIDNPHHEREVAKLRNLCRGHRLSEYRKEWNLSRREMARLLGIKIYRLPWVERGRFTTEELCHFEGFLTNLEAEDLAKAIAELDAIQE